MMPKHSSRAPWGRRLTAMVAVSTLTVAACSDSDNGGVGPSSIEVVQIVTVPNNQSVTGLIPNQTRQLLGVPTNSRGNFVDRTVTWASADESIVSVSATGLITAVSGGSTYIRATAGGQTDSIEVGVRFRVATVNLTPATATLRREAALQLTATLIDAGGATVTGRPVTWTTSDASIATVSSSGLVAVQATPIDGSTVTITATATNVDDGGVPAVATRVITVNGNAVVQTVTVAGGSGFRGSTGTVALTATAASGLGNVIAAPITWSTNSGAIATVDAGGVVSFVGGTGPLTVTATAAGAGADGADVSGTTTFEVALNASVGDSFTDLAITAGNFVDYAINGSNGPFRVTTSGGAGDIDIYLILPGVTNFVVNDNGGSGWACRPWAVGSNETCVQATPQAGWYRVRLWAYTDAGDVSGLTMNVTAP